MNPTLLMVKEQLFKIVQPLSSHTYSRENQMPLWQKDLNADNGSLFFLLMFTGLLGVNGEPADFSRFLVMSSCSTTFLCCLLFGFYFFKSSKDLGTNYEYRLDRIDRGWCSRINNNLRVFVIAGIYIANIFFIIFSLLGMMLYPYWQFLIFPLVISFIHCLFFTVTTALLDFRAQRLLES